MLALTVYALESLTVGLVALLCARIYKLANHPNAFPLLNTGNEQFAVAGTLPEFDDAIVVEQQSDGDYDQKMRCLKLAQAFSANQMFDIRRMVRGTQPEWLRQASSLYLTGAIDFIAKQHHCDNSSRKELIEITLKSNLRIDREHARAYFMEAVCREPESDHDRMVIAGATAARSWLEDQRVPENCKLSVRLQDWGILA